MPPPLNSNVGGLTVERGLALQSKKSIEANDYGREESTFVYALRNENYPSLVPAIGTAPPDVSPEVSGLEAFAHLGKVSHRFVHNGKSPGIGLLTVLYRGAIFGEDGNTTPVVDKAYTIGSIKLPVYTGEGEAPGLGDVVIVADFTENVYDYRARTRTWNYITETEPDAPQFAAVDDSEAVVVVDGLPDIVFPYHPADLVVIIFPTWKLVLALTEFTIKPCGRFFEVTESDQSKIVTEAEPLPV